MAIVSGEITVKGERWLLKDYRSPKMGEHYLSDGKVYQSLTNFAAIEFIIVEPAPKPWRVPTDEDAKRRPNCRTRMFSNLPWRQESGVLLAVLGDYEFPYVVTEHGAVMTWGCCEIQD